ncbi:hypothetical protein BD410DRAFT_839118, partial [Rickenella mellea]
MAILPILLAALLTFASVARSTDTSEELTNCTTAFNDANVTTDANINFNPTVPFFVNFTNATAAMPGFPDSVIIDGARVDTELTETEILEILQNQTFQAVVNMTLIQNQTLILPTFMIDNSSSFASGNATINNSTSGSLSTSASDSATSLFATSSLPDTFSSTFSPDAFSSTFSSADAVATPVTSIGSAPSGTTSQYYVIAIVDLGNSSNLAPPVAQFVGSNFSTTLSSSDGLSILTNSSSAFVEYSPAIPADGPDPHRHVSFFSIVFLLWEQTESFDVVSAESLALSSSTNFSISDFALNTGLSDSVGGTFIWVETGVGSSTCDSSNMTTPGGGSSNNTSATDTTMPTTTGMNSSIPCPTDTSTMLSRGGPFPVSTDISGSGFDSGSGSPTGTLGSANSTGPDISASPAPTDTSGFTDTSTLTSADASASPTGTDLSATGTDSNSDTGIANPTTTDVAVSGTGSDTAPANPTSTDSSGGSGGGNGDGSGSNGGGSGSNGGGSGSNGG